MSNQSYYKDRLGFDPNEASLYEAGGSPHKGDRYTSTPVRQAQKHHHYGNGNGATPDRFQSPSRGSYDSPHEGTPSKKSRQQQQQQSQQSVNNSSYLSESQNQSVYEESLTQFKGTTTVMSMWEHFVDNTDFLGTLFDDQTRFARCVLCAVSV